MYAYDANALERLPEARVEEEDVRPQLLAEDGA